MPPSLAGAADGAGGFIFHFISRYPIHLMRPTAEPIDISERGANGAKSNRRLFMQLLVFTGWRADHVRLAEALRLTGMQHVLYENANDPQGVGVLTFTENPDDFLTKMRPVLRTSLFSTLLIKGEMTMLGRSYSLGYEQDLDDALVGRHARYALDPQTPWHVWYPLRRAGEFETLSGEDQMKILREHGDIGFRYGAAGLAKDIRLACHGLGGNDNDFIIGLLGKELAPLSVLVANMRKTKQTSVYLESIGPFFVGKAVWHSHAAPPAPVPVSHGAPTAA